MITKQQRRNAERIKTLADHFGHLPYNAHGQTVNELCNLSIPCAVLICFDLVTGVVDSFDCVNADAVAQVEFYARRAVDRHVELHGSGWWNEDAERLALPAAPPEVAA